MAVVDSVFQNGKMYDRVTVSDSVFPERGKSRTAVMGSVFQNWVIKGKVAVVHSVLQNGKLDNRNTALVSPERKTCPR